MLRCCAASCSLARTWACLLSASQPLIARCQPRQNQTIRLAVANKLSLLPGNDTKLALECSIFCKPPVAFQDAMKRP